MSENHPAPRMDVRRIELLADVVAVAKGVLVEEEIPAQLAELAANAVADRLADYWGGQVITYPKDNRRRLAKLELEIYRAWSEGQLTFSALALKHKLHERSVRRLIARVRARLASDQQGLFEPGDGR